MQSQPVTTHQECIYAREDVRGSEMIVYNIAESVTDQNRLRVVFELLKLVSTLD